MWIIKNLDTSQSSVIIPKQLMRGRAEAARQAHNLKVIGSNPIPATERLGQPGLFILIPGCRPDQ